VHPGTWLNESSQFLGANDLPTGRVHPCGRGRRCRYSIVGFCLEPWGGKYKVPGHGALRVVIESPSRPVLEWELAEDIHTLIVHEPAGALATIYDGENQVRAE
jgi:hypothetical protein